MFALYLKFVILDCTYEVDIYMYLNLINIKLIKCVISKCELWKFNCEKKIIINEISVHCNFFERKKLELVAIIIGLSSKCDTGTSIEIQLNVYTLVWMNTNDRCSFAPKSFPADKLPTCVFEPNENVTT